MQPILLAALWIAQIVFWAIALRIIHLLKRTMHSIAEVVALVQQETTLEASILALLEAAKNNVKTINTLSDEDQAKVDSIFDELTSNIGTLTTATTANTPAEPAAEGSEGTAASPQP